VKALLISGAILVGLIALLFTLRSSRSTGMPSQEVLDRAAKRAREQAKSEQDGD
jgi:hypothetical protein